jgi:hypothetical protein
MYQPGNSVPLPSVLPGSGQNSGSQSTWLPAWNAIYGEFTAEECNSPNVLVQAVPARDLPRTIRKPHLVRRRNIQERNYAPLGSFRP